MELTENFTNSFQGIAVSPGIGIGRVMKVAGPGNVAPERLDIADGEIEGELERFKKALDATEEQLESLQKELRRKLNNLDADIFNAHLMRSMTGPLSVKWNGGSGRKNATPNMLCMKR